MGYVFVYITAPDENEAEKVANELLEKKLIACANIFPIKSGYWWKGSIEHSDEYALIAKTEEKMFKKVVDRVKRIHPYEVPCVIALPIVDGNPDYLRWIEESVE